MIADSHVSQPTHHRRWRLSRQLRWSNPSVRFAVIVLLVVWSVLVILPSQWQWQPPRLQLWQPPLIQYQVPPLPVPWRQTPVVINPPLRQGLDIQGGIQIVLALDTSKIPVGEVLTAVEAAREVITRRVDMYGIAEPVVQSIKSGDSHRLQVELPGVTDPTQAMQLVGQTAQLTFALISTSPEASISGQFLEPVPLTGAQLKSAQPRFDQQTSAPMVAIEFDEAGAKEFGIITEKNQGRQLAILLDGQLIMAPKINEPIYGGQAVINGLTGPDEAKQLAIQLSAGALPVPILVLEQSTIGPSLGSAAVTQSVRAGLIGLALVMAFMIMLYRSSGVIAGVALVLYALLTLAIYKTVGVTLTLPGIAGLLLTIGMAVDANILIFERMKEEQRVGKPFAVAMELGFGKAWDSIKDANMVTILTALVLINPFNFSSLNTSGLVRGFGITLLIGVILGLFTGIFVTRTLMRLFLQAPKNEGGNS